MKILVINGPNMNMLGVREIDIYGAGTLAELESAVTSHLRARGVEGECFQSNSEGAIIDRIHAAYNAFDGIIINPAAYTHTSIAIADALRAVGVPAVEVHLSDINAREPFRRVSFTAQACAATVAGKGVQGYLEAADILIDIVNSGK